MGFKLVGNQYQEIVANEQGLLWSEVLNLYLGVANDKLRYFTSEGELVPTPEEAATKIQKEAQVAHNQALEAERQAQAAQNQALEAERQLAAEREKSQLLAENLRSLGVDPESLV